MVGAKFLGCRTGRNEGWGDKSQQETAHGTPFNTWTVRCEFDTAKEAAKKGAGEWSDRL